jgi:hypothetical protein
MSSVPFAPVSVRPNACGALVARIGASAANTFQERLRAWYRDFDSKRYRHLTILDISASNHFISLGVSANSPEEFFVILHFCPSNLKRGNDCRIGLYPDNSFRLAKELRFINSEGVTFEYLAGEPALAYMDHFVWCQEESKAAREDVANDLFGDDLRVISNETHQGIGDNFVHLGSYVGKGPSVFLGNGGNAPSAVIYDCPTLHDVADTMGEICALRACSELRASPHGLGLQWSQEGEIKSHWNDGPNTFFEVMTNTGGTACLGHPGELPFQYRGNPVLLASQKLLKTSRWDFIRGVTWWKV